MRTVIVTILTLLMASACGHKKKVVIPLEVAPIVDEFVNEGAERGVDVKPDDLVIVIIEDGPIEEGQPDVVGRCEYFPFRSPKIKLDGKFMRGASKASKKALVFHELGHCLLKQGHRDWLPSLMNSYFPWDLELNYDYYMDELFKEDDKEYTPNDLHEGSCRQAH